MLGFMVENWYSFASMEVVDFCVALLLYCCTIATPLTI